MNKKKKRWEKNQFTGGKLIQHVTADKSNSLSKYCPYSFIADAFSYYCLHLPIASAEVHHSSHLISALKPLSYTVMWLTMHLADFLFGVCVNCSPEIRPGAVTFLWYSAFYLLIHFVNNFIIFY